jgi:hypothetical protein
MEEEDSDLDHKEPVVKPAKRGKKGRFIFFFRFFFLSFYIFYIPFLYIRLYVLILVTVKPQLPKTKGWQCSKAKSVPAPFPGI